MKYKKGTFIVIPNKDNLKGKPCEMQTLYFWLCCFANDEGQCFPSRPTLGKVCNFSSLKTVDKYLDMLIADGFIGKTKRKRKGSKSYISNLYQVRVLNAPPSVDDDPTPSVSDVPITISNINYINSSSKKESVGSATDIVEPKKITKKQQRLLTPYNFEVELQALWDSSWIGNKIIHNYWKIKGYRFENYAQFDSNLARELRGAKALVGYKWNQIEKAINYCQNTMSENIKWNLYTVGKVIAEVINKK